MKRALAAAVLAALAIAGCGGGPPKATVATCTAEIVQHPDEATPGTGCKGLSHDDLLKATIAAMGQGAAG